MKKFPFLFFGGVFLSMMFSLNCFAAFLQSGDNLLIDQPVLDDLYLLAGNASIDADVLGDLHVLGGVVTVNGNIKEDLVVAGGKVVVFGDVDGDLRVIGGQASIYGNIGDDLVALGGIVDVGPDCVINGSLISGAGMLTIDGIVKEDVQGGVGVFILNGTIEGDVKITVEDSITISPSAKIMGDLNYKALLEAEFPANTVYGNINHSKFTRVDHEDEITFAFLVMEVVGYLSGLVLVLLFVLFAPKILESSGKSTAKNVLKTFAVGILSVILAFVGSLILMMTIVGIPFALIVASLFLVIMYTAKVFAACWLSSYIINFKKKSAVKVKLFFIMSLMLLFYYLVGMVPYVGWLFHGILFLIGAGAGILALRDSYVYLKSKKQI